MSLEALPAYSLALFLGEKSAWGFAHLAPLLASPRFRVVLAVLPTPALWDRIVDRLLDDEPLPPSSRPLRQIMADRSAAAAELLAIHGVPVHNCDDANQDMGVEWVRQSEAQALLCAAFPQIFGAGLLAAAPAGGFNSHPSLLPRCRGAHPLFWALASGHPTTGTTIHAMTSRLDAGDIVTQYELPIRTEDTYSTLLARLTDTIPDLLDGLADHLAGGENSAVPQDEARASYFRQDRAVHHCIFWSRMSARQVFDLNRACDGRAYFWLGELRIHVNSVRVLGTSRVVYRAPIPAGTVVDHLAGAPVILTADGLVLLHGYCAADGTVPELGIGQVLV